MNYKYALLVVVGIFGGVTLRALRALRTEGVVPEVRRVDVRTIAKKLPPVARRGVLAWSKRGDGEIMFFEGDTSDINGRAILTSCDPLCDVAHAAICDRTVLCVSEARNTVEAMLDAMRGGESIAQTVAVLRAIRRLEQQEVALSRIRSRQYWVLESGPLPYAAIYPDEMMLYTDVSDGQHRRVVVIPIFVDDSTSLERAHRDYVAIYAEQLREYVAILNGKPFGERAALHRNSEECDVLPNSATVERKLAEGVCPKPLGVWFGDGLFHVNAERL